MKDKIVEDVEDEARGFLDYIEKCIRGALSPENSRVLTPENKRELEEALDRLRPSFDELAKWFIDPMRETSPSRAMYGYEKLWALLGAVFVGGSGGTVTDSGEIYFINYVKPRKCGMLAPALQRKWRCVPQLRLSGGQASLCTLGKRRARFATL